MIRYTIKLSQEEVSELMAIINKGSPVFRYATP